MIHVVSIGSIVAVKQAHPHRKQGAVGSPILRGFPAPFSDLLVSADVTPPSYSSSEIGDVDEVIVEVVFSEAVAAAGDDYTSGVTIKVNGVSQTISAGVRQADQSKVRYTIPRVDANDGITWEYASGPGLITDQAAPANDLADVSPQTATNNVGTHWHFDKDNDSMHLLTL